jgi:hypothetical protein
MYGCFFRWQPFSLNRRFYRTEFHPKIFGLVDRKPSLVLNEPETHSIYRWLLSTTSILRMSLHQRDIEPRILNQKDIAYSERLSP